MFGTSARFICSVVLLPGDAKEALTVVKFLIDRDRLYRPEGANPPSEETQIKEVDDVIIQVTQAYCPNGHNLIRPENDLFDGEPGIRLSVSDGKKKEIVILSPFHGDHARKGFIDFAEGARVQIACPDCGAQLPRLSRCSCGDGDLCLLYLTPRLDEGHVVALCNIWGCHRSKVFDQAQLLSAYMECEAEDDDFAEDTDLNVPYH